MDASTLRIGDRVKFTVLGDATYHVVTKLKWDCEMNKIRVYGGKAEIELPVANLELVVSSAEQLGLTENALTVYTAWLKGLIHKWERKHKELDTNLREARSLLKFVESQKAS